MEMKTEENKSKKLDIFPKEEIYTGKFVNYINSLSDNLKEYYKVSLNIIKNRTYITNSLENELNESIKANSFNISNNFKDLFYKLKFNNKAENDNLTNFYEDAKILFQEMKEYQKLVRCRIKKQGSLPGLIHNNSNKNSNLQKPYQQSDLNFIIDNNQKGFKIRKNDYTPIKRDLSNNNRNKYNIVPKERGEPYNFATINYTIDNSNDKSEEIEKYKKIIEQIQYFFYLKIASEVIEIKPLRDMISYYNWTPPQSEAETQLFKASSYVNKMLTQLNVVYDNIKNQIIKFPIKIQENLIKSFIKFIVGNVQDSYANIKKCNTTGRSIMLKDLKFLQQGFEDSINKKWKYNVKVNEYFEIIFNYVNAWYYDKGDLEKFVFDNLNIFF
jgi:hypothetical protein